MRCIALHCLHLFNNMTHFTCYILFVLLSHAFVIKHVFAGVYWSQRSCRKGFIKYNGHCFLYVPLNGKPFNASLQACEEHESSLAGFRNADEVEFLLRR
jgi:hypothetical protein